MRRHPMRSAVPRLLLAALTLAAAPAAAGEFSYAAFDSVLVRHLAGGRVDYGALARDPGPLERFLSATREARLDGWSRADRIAFWVNVYNARVLDGVIRRPGLKSVLDVGKIVGIPTLGFFRDQAETAGRKLSLNDIEHEILRREFRDARVHFVLNCASVSCPPLPPRALTAATLDSTLEAATRAFLADPTRNRIVAGEDPRLSTIFKWYRDDFVSEAGSLAEFVRRHGGGEIAPDARIRFLDYDWGLNGHW